MMSDFLFTFIAILLGVGTFIIFFMTLHFTARAGLPPDDETLEFGYVRIICPACSTVSDRIPLDHDFRDFTCRCGNRLLDPDAN